MRGRVPTRHLEKGKHTSQEPPKDWWAGPVGLEVMLPDPRAALCAPRGQEPCSRLMDSRASGGEGQQGPRVPQRPPR